MSQYGDGEADILEQSHGTLCVVRYQGKQALRAIDVQCIKSLIGMVPVVLSADEAQDNSIRSKYSQSFFVAEKPFNDIANDSIITYESTNNGNEDETMDDNNSEETDDDSDSGESDGDNSEDSESNDSR